MRTCFLMISVRRLSFSLLNPVVFLCFRFSLATLSLLASEHRMPFNALLLFPRAGCAFGESAFSCYRADTVQVVLA